MSWKKVTISSFLKERQNRIKPDVANSLNLNRIEKIDFSGNIYTVNNKQTKTNMILVKSEDLVISGINVEKGALAVYEGEEDVLATIHYSSYEFDKSIIDVEYLKWYLTSNEFMNILKEQVGGGIKTEVKPKKFLPLVINLPDINLQRMIVTKINAVSDEINELQQVIKNNTELLLKLQQSILQEAIQGKLVPQKPNDEPASVLLEKIKEEKEKLIKEKKIKKEKTLPSISEGEIPFELPEGWSVVRMANILFNIKYGTSQKCEYGNGNIPVLRIPNVKNGKVNIDDLKYTNLSNNEILELALEKNDILMIRSNGSTSIVGRTAIIEEGIEGYCYAGYLIRLRIMKDFVNAKFLSTILDSQFIRNQIELPIRTTSGVKNINTNEISNLIIPLPPLNEQQRIVEKVDQLMSLCDELKKNIEKSKKYSELLLQSVLQEAFKGN